MIPGAFLTWCLVFIATGLHAEVTEKASRPPLFDFVLGQILERQASIRSLVYTVESELTSHDVVRGQVFIKADTQVFQEGRMQALFARREITTSGEMHPLELRSVLNEQYVAEKFQDSEAVIFMHDSDPARVPRAATRAQLHADLNLLPFGFGDSFYPMTRQYALGSSVRWEVNEVMEQERLRYHLLQYPMPEGQTSQPGPGAPLTQLVVDPGRGFLITRGAFYTRDGHLFHKFEVTPQLLQGFGWFPQSVEEQDPLGDATPEFRQRLGMPPDSNVVRLHRFRYRSIQVNTPIPKETFTLDFLQIKEWSMIHKVNIDGTVETLQYRHGLPLPWKVARGWDLDAPVRDGTFMTSPSVQRTAASSSSQPQVSAIPPSRQVAQSGQRGAQRWGTLILGLLTGGLCAGIACWIYARSKASRPSRATALAEMAHLKERR